VADPTLAPASHAFFKIEVLDSATLAPVTGATLTLRNGVSYLSDTNGLVAFYEPGLMSTMVFFAPSHPAYVVASDPLGTGGQAFLTKEGGSGQLLMNMVASVPSPPSDDSQTALLAAPVPPPSSCFGLRAIDRLTRRGIPLVLLRTLEETFVSDSQGFVADCRADHAAKLVTFAASSDGYSLASGSTSLQVTPGPGAVCERDRL
jgi:hypothetical protein